MIDHADTDKRAYEILHRLAEATVVAVSDPDVRVSSAAHLRRFRRAQERFAPSQPDLLAYVCEVYDFVVRRHGSEQAALAFLNDGWNGQVCGIYFAALDKFLAEQGWEQASGRLVRRGPGQER